jgi:hypothetical protein
MTAAFLPPGKQTFVDANGNPLVGGLVWHYIPNSNTLKDTYSDPEATILNTNPVVLDGSGQAAIFGIGSYRQKLTDANGVVIWDRETTVGNQQAQTLGAGAVFGLTTGNNVANPTTQIDIAAGQCRDSTNTADIVLAAGLTKSMAAVWAAGTGQGGKDLATALAAGQSWHVFVIYNSNTGAVDVLFSQSPTAPTLPAGYTNFRRIASLPILGSDQRPPAGTNIASYRQWGDLFLLTNPNNEFTGQTGSNAVLLKQMVLPLGIKVRAIMYAQDLTVGGKLSLLRVTDPDLGVPAFGGTDQFAQIRVNSTELYRTAMIEEPTNTNAQIYIQLLNTDDVWALKTRGWWDYRGLNT